VTLLCLKTSEQVGTPGGGEALAKLVDDVERATAGHTVDVIAVEPWGNFTPALNALTAHAARQGCETILFASIEAAPAPTVVANLRRVLGDDGLVAGAALPGHEFEVGVRAVSGVTSPWNTLALWRVATLALVGFPLVSDGVFPAADGGVEEAAAIECLSRIVPAKATAYLVRLDDVEWNTTFTDPKRAEWHAKKMASKASRAAAQAALLGEAPAGSGGRVVHVLAASGE